MVYWNKRSGLSLSDQLTKQGIELQGASKGVMAMIWRMSGAGGGTPSWHNSAKMSLYMNRLIIVESE